MVTLNRLAIWLLECFVVITIIIYFHQAPQPTESFRLDLVFMFIRSPVTTTLKVSLAEKGSSPWVKLVKYASSATLSFF
jgi:AmiR/NasT family two-component response regulator